MPEGLRDSLLDRAACPTVGVSTTRTGSSRFASSSNPCRYNLRHANTWLAFTPCARATRATDAPGPKVSSTTRRFSSTECRRRCGTLLTTARSEVSTSPPSGHKRSAHLSHLHQLNIIRHHGHNRLSITHKFSSKRKAQLDVGQAGEASPHDRVSGGCVGSTREIAPESRDPDQVSRN